MTFGQVIRVQMMVAGLGMVLFCGGAARAQEITNTSFPDGPNVAPLAQSTMPTVATVTSAQPAVAEVQLSAAAAPMSESASSETLIWIGTSLVWLGAIGMYVCGPAKRFARQLLAMRESYKLSDAA